MSNSFIAYGGKTFVMRLNPNDISWTSSLNIVETPTLGGKVVQVLSASLDNLSISADCGLGGINELTRVANFFRDLILWQRLQKDTAVFFYEPRHFRFSVIGDSFRLNDSTDNVAYPYTLSFRIQEDLSGVATQKTIAKELADIQKGMDYKQTKYNMPEGSKGSIGDPYESGPQQQGLASVVASNAVGGGAL